MSEKGQIPLPGVAVLIGGPRAGYAAGDKIPLITKENRILVCLAQRGECRHHYRYYDYAGGMNSEKSWGLPQIEPGCSRRCPYRQEVADPKADEEYMERYPEYDPFGFRYYKRPLDACQYQPPKGKMYNHPDNCRQCSQPPVEPSDDWIDVNPDELPVELGYNWMGMS